jgi:protein-tyrosine phosphatase
VGRSAGEQPILLREFDPASVGSGDLDVPDPYYGGPRGFQDVLDLVQAACVGLLDVAARQGDMHPSTAGS